MGKFRIGVGIGKKMDKYLGGFVDLEKSKADFLIEPEFLSLVANI